MKELLALIIGFGLTYYLIILLAARFKLSSAKKRIHCEDRHSEGLLPSISVLKPVSGIDGNLYENLLSFVNQDYPEYEIVIGVQSADDPAIPLIKKLKLNFPEKKIKYTVSDRTLGYNPKVNNLYGMMPLAEYDYMVISDSNVVVPANYLRDNIKYFQDKRVGLVTNLIKGIGGKTIGALFENLHLNSFIIGNVSLLDLADREIVVGKSIFFRKSQFDRLGGLWELRNYLAEDYLMGRMYKKHGYKVVVSPQLVGTTNHSWTFKRFLNRHTRWAQLRWNLNKPAYFAELLVNFPLWSLVFAAVSGFSFEASLVTTFLWGAKITGDTLMNATLGTGMGIAQCMAAPIKDLVIAFTWPVPLVNRKTNWRGNPVKITRNTLLLPSSN
ncbi:MAG: glycosyltransferase [Bacteroidetes bacterium]|nr:glycosyltransferase [Bacteroidota bacterium]